MIFIQKYETENVLNVGGVVIVFDTAAIHAKLYLILRYNERPVATISNPAMIQVLERMHELDIKVEVAKS